MITFLSFSMLLVGILLLARHIRQHGQEPHYAG